ncbi:hypothetical protein ASPWEDRAFT_177220 [Aspergillus wentii DTO 134E9]|uniref:Cytochrome b5 heme-binding domain-containing protein n=1 Tax=Aspergillus wentii DTO 134E9 TaxID=1073089 RepID=A0A1L9R6Q5_ASPWE|nr:uncharacterized protein ASPWEDRAFT_177220 [Aspergillus wentii DTO 134E9]KAI9926770.1 hypothetical protein MW887_003865 [Aspergillus wentii]OJJ30568.1 hypothetical protein ASPWEDRAFT_177220 [Aspergillus wentii DTO 134E9]
MSEAKEFTLKEIETHNTKKDLFMIVHDKVYDCGSFVDEHPGGEEVLLDVGGQDATEAFEDVGHSDEAREILDGLFVGNVKRMPGDPEPKAHAQPAAGSSSSSSDSGFSSVALYAILLIGGAAAYGAYQYLQAANAAENTQ